MTYPIDTYTRAIQVIEALSQGHTLSRACDGAGINIGVFKHYVRETAELAELFVDAEQRGYDAMADALLNIDSDEIYGTSDPKKMKIISDNIKWFLARKRPQEYGERVTVQHTITADKAIVDALTRATDRAIAATIVDAEYTVVEQSEVLAIAPPAEKPAASLDTTGLPDDLKELV